MTTNLLDWHEEDQSVDPEAEYRMLLNGLRRTKGFGLFFVQCSPFGGEQIIQRVQADLADEMISVLKLEAPIADGNVFKRIHDFLDTQPKTQVLFIQGLELSLLDYEESKKRLGWSSEKIFSYSWQGVPPVLINLNQQRERFRDSFHTRLVFLLPIFAVKYLVHRAPDFFDWRSGVAQFADDADTLSRESQRIWQEGDYRQYLNWTQAQRNRRVLDIQSLLEAESVEAQDQYSLYFEQGNLFAASTEWEAAIAAYDAALAIKPDKDSALYNKGLALRKLGRYEEAIAAYDAALAIKPDKDSALYNKGLALRKLGRYEEAIAAYDAALAIKPDRHEALSNKGFALNKLGRYEEAIAAYDAALAIKPDKDSALYNKGLALRKLGRYEEAIAAYDAALAIKPDRHEALSNKGFALNKLGRYEEAIAAYDAALAIKPDKHEALSNKGLALDRLGCYEQAIIAYDAALAIKPDDHEALYNKGIALDRLGCYEEAIIAYDAALAIKPDKYKALYNKACAYALQKQIDSALENLAKAIQLKPDENREMAKTDSDFEAIRHDPRFQTLLS
jgi:tetratricopeptide (TPR) repeat protein